MKKELKRFIEGISTIALAYGISYLVSLFLDIAVVQFAKDLLLYYLIFRVIDVYKIKITIEEEISKIKL